MLRRMISRLSCSAVGLIVLLAYANGETIKVPQFHASTVQSPKINAPKVTSPKTGTTGTAANAGANTGYTSSGIPPQGVVYNYNSNPPTVTICGRTMPINKNVPKWVAQVASGGVWTWVNGQLVPVGKQK